MEFKSIKQKFTANKNLKEKIEKLGLHKNMSSNEPLKDEEIYFNKKEIQTRISNHVCEVMEKKDHKKNQELAKSHKEHL